MNWLKIETEDTLNEINNLSNKERVLIFKFSMGCSVDIVARILLEREWNRELMNMDIYIVDVIANKDISNKITDQYNILHHSPQCLIIENGRCIYSQSLGKIRVSELKHFANPMSPVIS